MYFIFTLVFGYILAKLVVADSGYVLIAYDKYVLESTLWSFALASFLFLVLVGGVISVFKILQKSVDFIHPISNEAKKRKAVKMTNKGLIKYANGQWKSAQKLLSLSAKDSQAPLLNYLAAARAANENQDYQACSEHLSQASKGVPNASIVIGITQAELLISRGQYEAALATLKNIQSKTSRHVYAYDLLYQTYLKLHDWEKLADLLPQLKKLKVLDEQKYTQLSCQVFTELFKQIIKKVELKKNHRELLTTAKNTWNKLERSQKHLDIMVTNYVECLEKLEEYDLAESVIREALTQQYSNKLVMLYGNLAADTAKQLSFLKKLYHNNTYEYPLTLALGILATKLKDDNEAEQYFNQSLDVKKTSSAYQHLAMLMMRRKEYTQSAQLFATSMEFT